MNLDNFIQFKSNGRIFNLSAIFATSLESVLDIIKDATPKLYKEIVEKRNKDIYIDSFEDELKNVDDNFLNYICDYLIENGYLYPQMIKFNGDIIFKPMSNYLELGLIASCTLSISSGADANCKNKFADFNYRKTFVYMNEKYEKWTKTQMINAKEYFTKCFIKELDEFYKLNDIKFEVY